MKQQFTWRSAVVLAFTLAVAGTAFGNGDEFFKPADMDGHVDLVYVGQIRDANTKRQIRELANIVVTDKSSGMTFLFTSDGPGHYHSPDIGASLKALGNDLDVDSLEMMAMVAGYKNVNITKLPRKSSGIVEVNLKMEPDGQASGLPESTDSPASSGGGWLWLTLGGGLAAIVVGAMVRNFVPRQSATR